MKNFLLVLILFFFTNSCSNNQLEKNSLNKNLFLIILDTSGSMNKNDKNEMIKINVAKDTLKDFILKLNKEKTNIALITFSGCDNIKLITKPSNNFKDIISKIDKIKANGATPLANSIDFANKLIKNINRNINIIILSDGAETCEGNPDEEINNLLETNNKINIFIIGYDVDNYTENYLKKFLKIKKNYFNAKNSIQLNEAFNNISSNLKMLQKGWEKEYYNFNIKFNTNSSIINKKYFKKIKEFATYLKTNNYKVEIQGYTDNTGEKKYNIFLSNKRALSIKKKLIYYGIEKNRIFTTGYGELAPIADNNTKIGRDLNRRTEAHIIKYGTQNVDFINKSNYGIPINIKKANKESFIGCYKMSDSNRNYLEYRILYILYSNNYANSFEFINNDFSKIQNDVFWDYNKNNKTFILDHTSNSKHIGNSKFIGKIKGNTNSFFLTGTWNNGKKAKISMTRIKKEEADCMMTGGILNKKNICEYRTIN